MMRSSLLLCLIILGFGARAQESPPNAANDSESRFALFDNTLYPGIRFQLIAKDKELPRKTCEVKIILKHLKSDSSIVAGSTNMGNTEEDQLSKAQMLETHVYRIKSGKQLVEGSANNYQPYSAHFKFKSRYYYELILYLQKENEETPIDSMLNPID